MKQLFTLLVTILLLTGCKKAIEKAAEDMVVNAMTNGQWVVTNFTVNGNNVTSDFTGYKFQYHKNKTVDAYLNGTINRSGTWDGNASTMTTWASFPGAPNPLSLINGAWNITDSGWTYVKATQTVGTEVKTMRLDKQ